MVLLTVIRHVEWEDGTGCKASIPTLASEAHQTQKTTIGHIKALVDAGLITRKRRQNLSSWTDITTLASVEPTLTASVETTLTGQRSGNASNQSSSSNPTNQWDTSMVPEKQETGHQETKVPETTEDVKTLEEEGATGVRGTSSAAAERKTYEQCAEWVEATMPGSSTFAYVNVVLRRYVKQWWRPHTGRDPKSGFAPTTSYSTAAKKYTESPEDWQRLRGNLIDKAFQDGGPFPVFEHNTDDGKLRLKEQVRCDTCKELTLAYGEKNRVFADVDGKELIDKCDDCLSRQLVGVK